MEWISGDSPTDLLSVSTGKPNSPYSERQKVDAKRRLLDLVCSICTALSCCHMLFCVPKSPSTGIKLINLLCFLSSRLTKELRHH